MIRVIYGSCNERIIYSLYNGRIILLGGVAALGDASPTKLMFSYTQAAYTRPFVLLFLCLKIFTRPLVL